MTTTFRHVIYGPCSRTGVTCIASNTCRRSCLNQHKTTQSSLQNPHDHSVQPDYNDAPLSLNTQVKQSHLNWPQLPGDSPVITALPQSKPAPGTLISNLLNEPLTLCCATSLIRSCLQLCQLHYEAASASFLPRGIGLHSKC